MSESNNKNWTRNDPYEHPIKHWMDEAHGESQETTPAANIPKDAEATKGNTLDHKYCDRDLSQKAVHHTLGATRHQASPGAHTHNGHDGSRKLGYNENIVLTGAKGGNVALTNLIAMLKEWIDFTDNTT